MHLHRVKIYSGRIFNNDSTQDESVKLQSFYHEGKNRWDAVTVSGPRKQTIIISRKSTLHVRSILKEFIGEISTNYWGMEKC